MGLFSIAAGWYAGTDPSPPAPARRVAMADREPPRRPPPPGVPEWLEAHRPPRPAEGEDDVTVAPGPAWAPGAGPPVARPVPVEPRAVGPFRRLMRWVGLDDEPAPPPPEPASPGGPRMLPPRPMTAPVPEPPQAAPWPTVDKYPTVIGGSNLTFERLSAILRTATMGYRREFVDAVNELLERDPHAAAVCRQRVLTVAGSRIEVSAKQLPEGDPRTERAGEIRAAVEAMVLAIPRLRQALAGLQWAVVYGVACQEVVWGVDPDGTVRPVELRFVHSRRIAYPDPMSWDARIWDQGSVTTWVPRPDEPTAGFFGLRIADYPGKFVTHSPQLRGDYPTREGAGRDISWWMVVKALGARGMTEFVERFGKPWVLGEFSTKSTDLPAGRAANKDDIAKGYAAVLGMGIGSMAGSLLPDAIKLKLEGPGVSGSAAVTNHEDLISIADRQVSKAVLGQSDTTDPGPNGSRSSTETRKDSTRELYRYDAVNLGETIDHDLVAPFVQINFPGDEDLCPAFHLIIDEKPGARDMLELVEKMVAMGAPVDADEVAADAGVPLVEKLGTDPRLLTPKGAAKATAPDAPVLDENGDPVEVDEEGASDVPDAPTDGTDKAKDGFALAPTDLAAVVRVDEARAAAGLPPWGGPDGALSIAEFKAKHSAVIAEAAAADAGKSKPTDPDKQPPPFGAPPGGAPFPPRGGGKGAPPAPAPRDAPPGNARPARPAPPFTKKPPPGDDE